MWSLETKINSILYCNFKKSTETTVIRLLLSKTMGRLPFQFLSYFALLHEGKKKKAISATKT